MLTLDRQTLAQMTGEELLQLLQEHGQRHGGDLQVGTQAWRAYKSTERRRGTFLNLWRDNGSHTTVHVRGLITQRIAEMRPVER
jgi:hypothetical protein